MNSSRLLGAITSDAGGDVEVNGDGDDDANGDGGVEVMAVIVRRKLMVNP